MFVKKYCQIGLTLLLMGFTIVILYRSDEQLLYDPLKAIETFQAFLTSRRDQRPNLFFFNGNGWLGFSDLEGQEHPKMSYNEKILKMLELRPEVILEANLLNLEGARQELFSRLADGLQRQEFHVGLSYSTYGEEIDYANPYSVFGGSRVHRPSGIPDHYDQNHHIHGPQLVLVNKKLAVRVDLVQGILSCSEETQKTNKDCITYNREIIKEAVIDNKQFFPTNPWFTAYSVRMASMLYLPERMDWAKSVVIRSFVAQAIFRLIGVYAMMSGTNLHTSTTSLPMLGLNDTNHMDSLVWTLKGWANNVRTEGAKNSRKIINLNDLVISAYEELQRHGHASQETVDGARRWVSALREINYDQIENMVTEEERFEEKNQVLAKPLPVTAAIFVYDFLADQTGLIQALYQGIYKETVFVVEPLNGNYPIHKYPIPASKLFYYTRPPGKYRVDIHTYLSFFDQMGSSSRAYEDVLIWHQDDLVVNLTFLNNFLKNEKTYFAGFPYETWEGAGYEDWGSSEVERVENAKNFSFPASHIWPFTQAAQESLKDLVDAEGYGYFEQNNTVCSLLNPILKKQNPDTYMLWGQAVFTQSDFFGVRWRHPKIKDFNRNLKKLFEYDVHHEVACPLAMRCTFSPEEIDDNYSVERISLVTFWEKDRWNVPVYRDRMSKGHVDMMHPMKLSFSEDFLRLTLEYRGLTANGL